MKKTLIALSIACAGALAFADTVQYNNSWFSGIKDATDISNLGAVNGAWGGLTADNASVEAGALVLDLDVSDAGEAEEATFTVTDTTVAKAADALPAQGIVMRGVFTPIAAEDLLTGKAMADKGAKVGFAIVNIGDETDSYKYYAWVGDGSEAESASAIADWVDLGEATEVATAKTIVIGLAYGADAVMATFAVGASEAEAQQLKSAALTGSALTKALADKVIASISCTGSGTLNELKGGYQYAVAEVAGVKYGTVEAAVEVAQKTGDTVKLVRAAEGDVTVAGGVTIDANGQAAPSVKVDEAADNSKEVATDAATRVVTVQTKKTILEDVKVGSGETPKGLMKDEAKFRQYLDKYCGEAYRKANTTADAIKAALEGMKASRALWQSYALGVEPEATLKLTQVESDPATDGITLALPVTPTGDFTVKYTVTAADGTATSSTEATAIKVPLATGRYTVKVSFE